MFNFLPKNEKFFEMFQQQANLLLEGARLLNAFGNGSKPLDEIAPALDRVEHEADRLTHDILIRLDRSFITPIDREDIHSLAMVLDDCLDFMESATERMNLYRLTVPTNHVKALAEVILKQAEELVVMIPKIKDLRYEIINPHCIEINSLENKGDKISRTALAELFSGNTPPLDVMKWRDVYDLLETTTDKCEDVAGIIEGIVLKNG